MAEKTNIQLKSGFVKKYVFTGEFYATNRQICDEFGQLYDTMHKNSSCHFDMADKHRDNIEAKETLCNMLDSLYGLGVKIWNGSTNNRYRSKGSHRKYVMGYGTN